MFWNTEKMSRCRLPPSYDVDGYTYGFTLYIAIKAQSTRKERMKLLAEQMSQVHQKMEQLNYESYVLSKHGKQEASYRKAKAAKIAKECWIKLDKKYRKIWKYSRNKNGNS